MNRITLQRFVVEAAVSIAVGSVLVIACGDGGGATGPDPQPEPQPEARDVVQSAARTFGTGRLRTWAEMDGPTPVAIGISFTEESLDASGFSNIVAPLPAAGTLWDHLGLDWNPNGHPPPGVYDVPHFDVHFYMISQTARSSIPGGADPVEPEERYRPPGYAPDAVSVPAMGVHWSDQSAPEFTGGMFTYTVVYGFSAGAMVFLEPMITRAFLGTRTSVSQPIAQSPEVQRTGHYPSELSVTYNAANRQYDIFLSGFVMRQAS